MSSDFALDLRVARRQAGFTQDDVARLLGVTQSQISDLEHGRVLPTLQQICSLSLIFGRSFESLFSELMQSARRAISGRLPSISAAVRSYVGTFNREASLKRMERRLQAESPGYGAE